MNQGGKRVPERAKKTYVAVIGGGAVTPEVAELAVEVGRELARRGAVVICGGLGGVMEAVARGVREEGGVSLGILPGPDRVLANPHLTYSLPTNLGHARNIIIAHAADAVIAIDGGYGTISEAAIALKLGKPVIGLALTWALEGVRPAATPAAAVAAALRASGSTA